MALFDDIGRKITQVSQDAVKGTKDFAEVTRLNSLVSDEQRRMNSIYMQLGMKFYQSNSHNAGHEFSEQFNNINECVSKIEKYQDEIRVIKGLKKCGKCGENVEIDIPFCGKCGHNTSADQPKAEPPIVEEPIVEQPIIIDEIIIEEEKTDQQCD